MPTPSAPNPEIPVPSAPLVGELNATKPQNRSALNKILGDRPIGERYSPQDLQNVARKYLPTIGLGDEVSFGANAFEAYNNARVKGYNGLQKAKVAEGDDPIQKKLNANVTNEAQKIAIEAVKEGIKRALDPRNGTLENEESDYDIAQHQYSASVQVFKDLVAEVSGKRNVQDIIGVIEEVASNAKGAIQKQQDKEITKLNEEFANDGFKTSLKAALNIGDDQIADVQKSIIDDLQETHKKQLEAFDKSTQESLKALHSASAKQRQAFLFIASLHKNDEKMQRAIERLAGENYNAQGPKDDNIIIECSKDKAAISSVSLDQLKVIQLLGGGQINRVDGQPVSYKLDMGNRFTSPRYYLNNREERDMLIMAQAVRASGSSGIVMKLDFKDEKTAEARARQAYAACIKAGFPPEKIKLNVNGQLMTYKAIEKDEKDGKKYESIHEKLYAKRGSEFSLLQQQSQTIRADLEAITKTPTQKSTESMREIKTALEELKKPVIAKMKAKDTPPTPDDEVRTGISMK